MHNRDSGISAPSTSAQNIQLRSVVGNLTMINAKKMSVYLHIYFSFTTLPDDLPFTIKFY